MDVLDLKKMKGSNKVEKSMKLLILVGAKLYQGYITTVEHRWELW